MINKKNNFRILEFIIILLGLVMEIPPQFSQAKVLLQTEFQEHLFELQKMKQLSLNFFLDIF